MPYLEDYTDEELGAMLRQASHNMNYYERERVSTLDAFCSWLNIVGLGFIADAIKIAAWVWDRIRDIWHSIFG
jgi:hypothetical protein